MSRIATKPSPRSRRGRLQRRAGRRGSPQRSGKDPLLGDRARRGRGRARRPARRRATASSRRRSRGRAGRRGRRPRADLLAPAREARARREARAAARSAPSSPRGGTVSAAAVDSPGPRRVREDVDLRDAAPPRRRERAPEGALVLGREADDHVGRQVEVAERLEPAQVRRGVVAARPSRGARRRRPTGAARAGGAATVGVSRSAATSSASTWLTSIEDSRRRSSPGVAPASRTSRGSVVAGVAVAVAAEVDAGQDDLAVALRDAPARPRRAPRRRGGCASRRARAGSRRSCTRSCSRPGSSRTRARGRAARRPGRSRSRRRRPRRRPASPRFASRRRRRSRGSPANASAARFARAAGDVDARRACAPRATAAWRDLRDRLVRDAAGVDDRDLGARRARSSCPSASSRSRIACASACETLQPRKANGEASPSA